MITSFFRYNGFTPLSILVFFAYVVVILVAIVSHELAHGYVAYWNGDPTAKINGRLSLNPFKHLTPIGTLMMLLVGFGFAKPVPIDSRNFRDFKKGMITTSLAGVTVNFIYAFIASIALAILVYAVGGKTTDSQTKVYAFNFFYYLFYFSMQVNILLAVFNLLPLYPLDGFRIVETLALPDNKYVVFMYRYGNFVLLGFIALSYLMSQMGLPTLFGMVNDISIKVFNIIWGGILGVTI